ncbi:MAG TPA: BadF/BadG/BcrA/BcrD ATPase family protein [Rhizomicrobium sp.]|nr:BadF/BadG/BcrA/BcrD ATPase family protein [Rhizomicrobium sp.]
MRKTAGAASGTITDPLFIGVDGGGSGCRARIADGEGHHLGAGHSAPAAVRLGIERAMAAVLAAARAASADAGLPGDALRAMHAVVGLAGIGRKSVLEQLKARPHPFRSVVYVNDATIACIGAHGGRDGGIVIVGTGSVGLARKDGCEIRVGGYGFPVSDEGSGADLGLRAIRCSLRSCDGRLPPTDLTRAVMARFANDPFEFVAWADQATATDYAHLAPLVMGHAESGDPVAREIAINTAREIDSLARRLVGRGVSRIALVGGVARRMEPWLADDVRRVLVSAEGDGVDGALILARHLLEKERQGEQRPPGGVDAVLQT